MLSYEVFQIGTHTLRIYDLIIPFIVLGTARLIVHFSVLVLKRFFNQKGLEKGREFALLQIFKYLVYTIAVVIALENMGLQLSIILASSAALLVGVGLGLQQTFNDITCGIILLFEGSVKVDDVVNLDDTIGRVESIGIRTSVVTTRENLSIIVPNSKFITAKVYNLSYREEPVRFTIHCKINYQANIELVKQLLTRAALEQKEVEQHPTPLVLLTNFGQYAIELELYFWTKEFMPAELIKSDIRERITALFRQHNIQVPLPQQVIYPNEAIPTLHKF
jgi:small-conductance mechanosensitive channel